MRAAPLGVAITHHPGVIGTRQRGAPRLSAVITPIIGTFIIRHPEGSDAIPLVEEDTFTYSQDWQTYIR